MKKLSAQFRSAYPDNPQFIRNYARSVLMLGDVARLAGDSESAEKSYTEAISAFEQLSEQAQQLDVRFDISVCCGRLGELAVNRKDYDSAEKHFGRGLELRRQLERDDDVFSRESTGLFYQRMGVVAFEKGELDQAEEMFLQADKRHAACAEETHSGAVYGEAAYNLYYFGKISRRKGKFSQAEENLKNAIKIADSLSEQFRDLPKYRVFQCLFYDELAEIYAKQSEFSQADDWFEKSSDIAIQYSRDMEENAPGNIASIIAALKAYQDYRSDRFDRMRINLPFDEEPYLDYVEESEVEEHLASLMAGDVIADGVNYASKVIDTYTMMCEDKAAMRSCLNLSEGYRRWGRLAIAENKPDKAIDCFKAGLYEVKNACYDYNCEPKEDDIAFRKRAFYIHLADVYLSLGKSEHAEANMISEQKMCESLFSSNPTPLRRSTLGLNHDRFAHLYEVQEQKEKSREHLYESLNIYEECLKEDNCIQNQRLAANAHFMLGLNLMSEQEIKTAAAMLKELITNNQNNTELIESVFDQYKMIEEIGENLFS